MSDSDGAGCLRRAPFARRQFLKLAIGGAAAGGLAVYRLGGYSLPERVEGLRHLSPGEAAILYALLDTLLPRSADHRPLRLRDHVRFIDGYLAGLDRRDVSQLRSLLWLLEHATLPLGAHLARFTRLGRDARERYVLGWQHSSLGVRRLGYQSLKALAFLACYRSPESFIRIGYPGPATLPGFVGSPESQAFYAGLLAPSGSDPRSP